MKTLLLSITLLIGISNFSSVFAQCSVSVKDSLHANGDFILNAKDPIGTPPFTYTWTIVDGNAQPLPHWESMDHDSVIIDMVTLQNAYGCVSYKPCMTDGIGCQTCAQDTALVNVNFPCFSQYVTSIVGPNQVSISLVNNMPPFLIVNQMVTWTDGDNANQAAPYMGPVTTITYNPGPNPTTDKFNVCVMTTLQTGGCIYCDSVQYTNNLAVKDQSLKSLQVNPNPVNTYTTIKSPSIIQSIQLFNALGQKIVIPISWNDKEAMLHFEQVSKGVYIVRIQTANGVIDRRLIKD
ncbi:MAG TPA: T9SS type A sorting domain-containing protein [Fluviicola sp.]|nr:T9SS type A sorting domain-containing protein [Fluviicola sp.]